MDQATTPAPVERLPEHPAHHTPRTPQETRDERALAPHGVMTAQITTPTARRLADASRSQDRRDRNADLLIPDGHGGKKAPVPDHMHGRESTANNHKCPCDDCKRAASEARAKRARSKS